MNMRDMSETQQRVAAALNTPTSALKEIRELKARIKELESAFRSILQIPNSDAAQGIMKAFAEDALGEET